MEKAVSPKRMQKAGKFGEALGHYLDRYQECLQEGDAFLSGHYLDEIAQTLIDSREGSMSFEELEHGLSKAIGLDRLEGHSAEQALMDLQVSLRKRFPGHFKDAPIEDE